MTRPTDVLINRAAERVRAQDSIWFLCVAALVLGGLGISANLPWAHIFSAWLVAAIVVLGRQNIQPAKEWAAPVRRLALRAVDRREEAEAKLRLIQGALDSLVEPVLIIDGGSRIADANKVAKQFFGNE